jgi:hypothetical protein
MKIWLVYQKVDGGLGASNITPRRDLSVSDEHFKICNLPYWIEGIKLDAEAMVRRGNFIQWWFVEAETYYKAIKTIKSIRLQQHISKGMLVEIK